MAAFTQTFPVMPIPSLPALMASAASRFPQVYQNLPVFPGMPLPSFDLMKRSAFTPPPMQQQVHKNTVYTQAELDMLLYGYGISKSADGANHALSGLRVSQFGAEKMVGGNKHPRSTQTHTVDDNIHLPDGVVVHQSTFAGLQHSSTFTTKALVKGQRFGPFQGKKVYTSEIKTNDGNSHMWEIFTEGKLQCFIDGRGSNGNWMAFVNCARYPQEQNLDAVQVGEEIFYQASKEIPAGKELLVWYGDSYNLFMGIPIGLKDDQHKTQEQTNQQITTDSVDANGYSCERCGKVFAYKYYKDKHLKYTRCVDQGDRKFPCNLCSRSFEKRDRLRIHILHVHEKHRPHKCNICNKCFSQSSSLNKHMRVHSGERPYKCVYCNKAFTASSILRTHIRQHSGEKPFKCKFCGKAFASHAAHDSHVRRTHAKEKSELPSIYNSVTPKGLNFTARDDYYFHVYDKGTQLFNTKAHSLCSSPAYSTMSSLQSDDDSITGNATGKREEIDVVG